MSRNTTSLQSHLTQSQHLRGLVAHATAPSNIAFIKYWGKRDAKEQWPANDSLSMTLDSARTETWAQIAPDGVNRLFRQEGVFSASEENKAFEFVDWLRKHTGFSAALHFETWNSFPAAAGIASSASGFAALTLAALGAWTGASSLEDLASHGFGLSKLAALSRFGSGSACRSWFGGFVEWSAGDHPLAQTVRQVAPAEHWNLCNLICILSSAAKEVGSTAAHSYASSSPFFAPRLAGLGERQKIVARAIAGKDLVTLGRELEAEALEMHTVMQTATPSIRYMTDESVQLLAALRQVRQQQELPFYFTMDAGPNVHVICESQDRERALLALREITGRIFPSKSVAIIEDRIGSGPSLRRVEVTSKC